MPVVTMVLCFLLNIRASVHTVELESKKRVPPSLRYCMAIMAMRCFASGITSMRTDIAGSPPALSYKITPPYERRTNPNFSISVRSRRTVASLTYSFLASA